MRGLRYIAAVIVVLAALLATLVAWSALDMGHIDRTIRGSRSIDANFRLAAAFIETQREQIGQTPSAAEFSSWADQFSTRIPSVRDLELRSAPYSPEITAEHGIAPADSYVLTYWRGEWEESYASWTDRSSMTFEPSDYFAFGSRGFHIAAALAFAISMAFAARWIWPGRAVRPNTSLERTHEG